MDNWQNVLEEHRNGYDAENGGPRDTGWVSFPRHLKDMGEGGMYVVAVISQRKDAREHHFPCFVLNPYTLAFNTLCDEQSETLPPMENEVLASVVLGASSGAWWDAKRGRYW